MNRVDAIAFDLDGTLIDSADGIAQALNHALAAQGLPSFDLTTVRGWIGDGPDALIARALASGERPAGGTHALAARLRPACGAASTRPLCVRRWPAAPCSTASAKRSRCGREPARWW